MGQWNPRWNLETVYRGFSDPAFLAAVEQSGAAFSALEEALRGQERFGPEALASLLRRFDDAALTLSTPETYHAMRCAVPPADAAANAAALRISEVRQRRQSVFARLEKALSSLASADLSAAELEQAGLGPYRFLLSESRRLAPHRPEPAAAALLEAMRENGSRAWAALRNDLDAAARVPLDLPEGRRLLSLSEARGLQTSPDAKLRRLAWEAELSSYPAWAVPMAACLSGIKGEALAELPSKAYASVREEMLDINKMSGRTLDALHAALADHLPALRSYLRAKARLLGRKNGLPWYDLLAPLGQEAAEISLDEARELVLSALGGFDPALGDLAGRAFDEGWIDALPQPGKQSGGICYDLPLLRENRVLVNYDGSVRSVKALAHELGHAYHSRCLDETPFCLRDVPTPLCETASLFNETLLSEALRMRGASRLTLLDRELSEAVQTLMDVYSRYLFEDAVFAARAKGRLTAEDLCRIMTDAQREVFRDSLDPGFLHPYMWMCKVHYYIPGFHYYSYPYYFGLLFSKGLFALYRREGAAFPARYRALLARSGSVRLEQSAAAVGARITDRSFWDDALSAVDRLCEEFCSLAGTV